MTAPIQKWTSEHPRLAAYGISLMLWAALIGWSHLHVRVCRDSEIPAQEARIIGVLIANPNTWILPMHFDCAPRTSVAEQVEAMPALIRFAWRPLLFQSAVEILSIMFTAECLLAAWQWAIASRGGINAR